MALDRLIRAGTPLKFRCRRPELGGIVSRLAAVVLAPVLIAHTGYSGAPSALSGVHVLGEGWQIKHPVGLALSGNALFVAQEDDSIIEVNASTGASIRELSGAGYRFNGVDAVAATHSELFVSNGAGNSVTEVNASAGTLTRVIAGSKYRFDDPDALAVDGSRLFVANDGNDSLTEINSSTGTLVKVIAGRRYRFDGPDALALSRTTVSVASSGNSSVTAINVTTGAPEMVLRGASFQLDRPDALALGRGHLFVMNGPAGTVSAIDVTKRKLLYVVPIPTSSYDQNVATAMTLWGARLFVAYTTNELCQGENDLVEQYNAANGQRIRTVPTFDDSFGEVDVPDAMLASAGEVFLANLGGMISAIGSVIEFSASTGRFDREFTRSSPYDFDGPDAIALIGPDLFVANDGYNDGYLADEGYGNSVTELNAATGAFVRVLSSPALDGPYRMAVREGDLFVANFSGDSVTELDASTGVSLRVFRGPKDAYPTAIATDGSALFIAWGDSISEVDVVTGNVVRVISGSRYGFDDPAAMVTVGPDLFVANASGNSLTEVEVSTGALVKVISAPQFQFDSPSNITVSGGDVYVVNDAGRTGRNTSVTQLNGLTGSLVRVISGSAYRFNGPGGITAVGAYVFVTAENGNSVTQINAETGTLVKVYARAIYHFDFPSSVAARGGDLYVANFGGYSLTVFPSVN